MKKLLIIGILCFVFGYTLYQNQGRFFLILLSQHRLSNPFQTNATIQSAKITLYKDGTYTGDVADAFYGNVQVKVAIQNKKIADVQFLQYPHDATRSLAINTLAMPNLKQEAIQSQQANIDIISGATDTSKAFIQSVQSALAQAK